MHKSAVMDIQKELIDAIIKGTITEDDIPEKVAIRILAINYKSKGWSCEKIRRKFSLKNRMQAHRLGKKK